MGPCKNVNRIIKIEKQVNERRIKLIKLSSQNQINKRQSQFRVFRAQSQNVFWRKKSWVQKRGRSACLKLRFPCLKVREVVKLKANLEEVDVEGATVRERNSRRQEDIEAICCFWGFISNLQFLDATNWCGKSKIWLPIFSLPARR